MAFSQIFPTIGEAIAAMTPMMAMVIRTSFSPIPRFRRARRRPGKTPVASPPRREPWMSGSDLNTAIEKVDDENEKSPGNFLFQNTKIIAIIEITRLFL
ncbi:MAG: hypothetical protein KDM91_06780 [Verrucomicrobiae bacterium]|nr:hypothetical protein [Verrucomicrobiae bacterium]